MLKETRSFVTSQPSLPPTHQVQKCYIQCQSGCLGVAMQSSLHSQTPLSLPHLVKAVLQTLELALELNAVVLRGQVLELREHLRSVRAYGQSTGQGKPRLAIWRKYTGAHTGDTSSGNTPCVTGTHTGTWASQTTQHTTTTTASHSFGRMRLG